MKIGVVVDGDSLSSYVAEDFGRASHFLIVDYDTYDYEVVVNEFAKTNAPGYKVAEAIASLDVDVVIAGGIGHHGIDILQKAGKRVVYDEDDTVEECLDEFKRRFELERKFEGKQR